MIHIGLFEGVGGFSLAASQMGWNTLVTCEINPFGQRVLKYYWPNAYHHGDIKTLNYDTINNELTNRFGAGWRNDDIIITGGFPCQPYSIAGKRLGKEDDRHLWPEMLRVIREVQPTWVVGENVFGLINWNGGLVFDEVQTDLEAEGYEVQPYVLPAASVNAPHKRDRVWFVAHRTNSGTKEVQQRRENGIYGFKTTTNSSLHGLELLGFREGRSTQGESESNIRQRQRIRGDIRGDCEQGVITNSESQQSERMQLDERESCQSKQRESGRMGCEGITESDVTYANSGRQSSEEHGQEKSGWLTEKSISNDWENFPTFSPICTRDDGIQPQSHEVAISENRNNMDRNIVIKLCIDEGRLKVDFNTGKIYSLKQRGKEGQEIELLGADCNGYIVHGIRYNGFKIQLRAHQIVWIAANGLYDKSALMIDHINRNKKDNRLENLRLVDAKGNRENSTEYKGKFTDEQKDMMVWLYKEDSIPMREIAENYGISKSRVQQIISEHSGIYGITFPRWRNESIKAMGNAIVPQVALQIFKAIEKYNNL